LGDDVFTMNEYIISLANKYACVNGTRVDWVSFAFATVFKKKERAEAFAKKCGGAVEPFYGKAVTGNKSFVAPKQSPINRHSPYRTI
jgi:hypothetical protein